MGPRVLNGISHQLKDPTSLTPYEQKLWELKQQGLNSSQIREALQSTASNAAINSRLKIIREKLEAQEAWAR